MESRPGWLFQELLRGLSRSMHSRQGAAACMQGRDGVCSCDDCLAAGRGGRGEGAGAGRSAAEEGRGRLFGALQGPRVGPQAHDKGLEGGEEGVGGWVGGWVGRGGEGMMMCMGSGA
jgi:hypothetical protein